MQRKINCRRLYEKHHGVVLPEDVEVHHIIPAYEGGLDEIANLIAITKEEHKQIHLDRYNETGNFRELCSHHMIGYNFTEAHKVSSSEGGKSGGKKVKELGTGICSKDTELRKKWASLGGKVGGKVQHEQGLGIHAQTREERLEFASMGGKKGAFTQPKWQSEFGKRGGVKNKGFVWLTDGTINIKYTKIQQEAKSSSEFITENPTFRLGRTTLWQR